MMDHSNGYLPAVVELLNKIESEQYENIKAAAELMADAVQQDKLINVYGGGGHTTLPVGEMFFRAGGLCNINPCMETACLFLIRRRSIWLWSGALIMAEPLWIIIICERMMY